jgi:hypothetical protein
MRSNLKCLKKQLDDKDRASKAAVCADVVEEVKALFAANPKTPVIVQELKAYSNTKVSPVIVSVLWDLFCLFYCSEYDDCTEQMAVIVHCAFIEEVPGSSLSRVTS